MWMNISIEICMWTRSQAQSWLNCSIIFIVIAFVMIIKAGSIKNQWQTKKSYELYMSMHKTCLKLILRMHEIYVFFLFIRAIKSIPFLHNITRKDTSHRRTHHRPGCRCLLPIYECLSARPAKKYLLNTATRMQMCRYKEQNQKLHTTFISTNVNWNKII